MEEECESDQVEADTHEIHVLELVERELVQEHDGWHKVELEIVQK